MVVRIIIAGESQCEVFAEVCLVADHLSQNLPNFCYERMEIPVLEWEGWLYKTNQMYKWHHIGSPLVWKELLMKGSQPIYIGSGADFLEYCYSYYDFDSFVSFETLEGLAENIVQFQKKVKIEDMALKLDLLTDINEMSLDNSYAICISGAGHPLTMQLISGLLDMSSGERCISKIYIYDYKCSQEFMESVERECNYISSNYPGRVVRYVEKIGIAVTNTDLLIVLDHVPFSMDLPIGDWLRENKRMMSSLSLMLNASASRKMYILFPNLGPACYNATILSRLTNLNKNNIVVATSDSGLAMSSVAAEIAEVPLRNMFSPPVWGFVGINHLVDIRTTFHKYNSFEPYNRYTKVKNSTLMIGSLTPEFRTMEYLMYFDDTLWKKVAEIKKNLPKGKERIKKAIAVLNVVRLWLFDRNPKYIINLGICCDGTFGLNFKGKFSQPARLIGGEWAPAGEFPLPKDPQMSLKYLEQIAEFIMTLEPKALPRIIPFYPCSCKLKYYKKKTLW